MTVDRIPHFRSAAGGLQLALGQPTWVVSDRAVASGGEFTTQSLAYSAQSMSSNGVTKPLAPQVFLAATEARWVLMS